MKSVTQFSSVEALDEIYNTLFMRVAWEAHLPLCKSLIRATFLQGGKSHPCSEEPGAVDRMGSEILVLPL